MVRGVIGIVMVAALSAVCLSPKQAAEAGETTEGAAYLAAAAYGDGFLAVGTQGRVAAISAGGGEERLTGELPCTLTDVAVEGSAAVAVGDGAAVRIESGRAAVYETEDCGSVCAYRGEWLLGGEAGRLLQTEDFETWNSQQLPVRGRVTGLAASEERCMAVTDLGEVAVTTDGRTWTSLNYNEYYGKNVTLEGIEALDGMFWAYGTDQSGAAAVIMSLEGGVWTERELMVMEQSREIDLSGAGIAGLCSDGEQQIAALDDGRVLTMPSCVVCNKVSEGVDWRPEAIACHEGELLLAGEGYQYQLLDTEAVRQDRIQPEAAREKQRNGAVIIDVRSAEDYAAGHIAGSISLPVDQVAAKLPALLPDRATEILFYCASGQRSQTALETARSLGYSYVYNLGGLSDWPYEVEP